MVSFVTLFDSTVDILLVKASPLSSIYLEMLLVKQSLQKQQERGEVVVAQLVERSLPIPEVRGSNPVIGKNLFIY